MTGDFLKKKLEDAGFTALQVAELIGISPQNLNNKFNSSTVKVDFLIKIASAVNKSVYFFLDGLEDFSEDDRRNQNKTVDDKKKRDPLISLLSEEVSHKIKQDLKEDLEKIDYIYNALTKAELLQEIKRMTETILEKKQNAR